MRSHNVNRFELSRDQEQWDVSYIHLRHALADIKNNIWCGEKLCTLPETTRPQPPANGKANSTHFCANKYRLHLRYNKVNKTE